MKMAALKRFLIFFLVVCPTGHSQNCQALTPARKSALVNYIRKQYQVKEGTELVLIRETGVGSSCYRELTFQGKSPVKTWELTMYLTPDERFLSAELLDTALDPVEQRHQKAEALMAGLAENKGASKGPERAQVTIVEFSDFQCPFCRKLADLLQKVLPTEKDSVRLVYHHMPLTMHTWARIAAEGAACAQLQNSKAFWAVHDNIFEHQQEITTENVRQKLIDFAVAANSLDITTFKNCLDNELSLGLVYRDMNLASEHQINGTPTIFINGRRIEGVRDATQLHHLVEDAKAVSKTGAFQSANTSAITSLDENR